MYTVAFSSIACDRDKCQWGCLPVDAKSDYKALPESSSFCWIGSSCKSKPSNQCTTAGFSDFDNYWVGYDYNSSCKNLTVDCTSLGYSTASLSSGLPCKDKSDPFRCPFDHEQIFCESGICDFYNQADCENTNPNFVCQQKSGEACFYTSGCKTNFCLYSSACYQVCDTSTYKYFTGSSYLPSNASPDTSSSSCLGYAGTSAGNCSGQSLTRYTDFVCNSDFCKANNQCNQVWTDSLKTSYPYTAQVSNATMGASATYYDGASAGNCSTTSTRYPSFTCNSGYYKNSAGTGCEECTYKDNDECQEVNYNSVCTPNSSTGCYEPTGCKTYYYQSCSSPLVHYNTDGFGCGSCGCDASVYKYYSPSYPKTGVDCCSGARVLNGTAIGGGNNCKDFTCADGYTKSGDECVSACTYTYTASDGGYTSSGSCVRDGVTYYKSKCSGSKSCNVPYKLKTTCVDATGKSWGDCELDNTGVCKSAGYDYAVATAGYGTSTSSDTSTMSCAVTGGYPAIIGYNGTYYYYTCCNNY